MTLVLLHVALSVHASQERPMRDIQALKGTSAISGRVVSVSGEAGISEAIVTGVETASAFTKSVTTDPYGAFLLDDLPGGRYILTATKATFVAGRYGQRTPDGTRRALTLADGKTASGVQIMLWRAGVIAGRIETELGEPMPGVTVNVMRLMVDGAVTRFLPIRSSAVTSDTGDYRIHGVDPGSYFIVATPPPVALRKGLKLNAGYRPTFYPGATAIDAAQGVSVAAESTAVANIVLQVGRLVTVDGILLDPSGGAATNGIRVHAGSDGLAVQPKALVFGGRFSFPLLAEGAYTFRSDVTNGTDGRPVVFLADATIDGQDPVMVTLSAMRVGTITGTVRLPRDFKQPALSLQVWATPQFDTRTAGALSPVKTSKDNTFKLMAWPGPNRIQVRVDNPGLFVKAIWLRGVDVADDTVAVGNGVDLDGMEIDLTDVTQVLTGRVTIPLDGDEPLEDLAVVVFPIERRLRNSVRRTALVRVDQRGEFSVRSLPPGTYAAVAVPFTSGVRLSDHRFLESVENTAQTVSLGAGGKASVTLRR
jgi:hypothetical protein